MVYVTGDIHADIERLKSRAVKRLKRNDTLIVCGDFGFVWDGSKTEQKLLKWLGKRRYHLLFVEGTHDNLDLLAQYPEVDYCGGRARQISGRCHQLLRGEVYTIEENRVFAFGGGESADMDTRVQGESWWAQELPSEQELEHAREQLQAHGNEVDYIVTHQPSNIVTSFLDMDNNHTNQLASFLDEVSQQVRYQHWFFGYCHIDKIIPPKYHALYQEVVPMNGKL